MEKCLFFLDSLTYGVRAVLGKAAVLVLMALPVQADDTVTVLALGDSLTQGFGLAQPEGFVPQLSTWLSDAGVAVEIINGGVSGDTTAGGAARVAWSLTPEVDAMIVALGGNDMLRGLDPADVRRNLTQILEVAQSQDLPVLLVGMQAPSNYGPDYKAAFDAIYPELSQTYETLYFDSFFKGLGDSDPAELQVYFQPDGLHPNATGVLKIVEGMGPSVIDLIEQTK